MEKGRLTGPLILLAITSIALALHMSDLRPERIAHHTNNSQIDIPEQRFLTSGPMDINKVSAEELEAIPRIGPSLAKKIIEYRAEKGRINDINKLLDIKGVGIRLLSTIQLYLRVEE